MRVIRLTPSRQNDAATPSITVSAAPAANAVVRRVEGPLQALARFARPLAVASALLISLFWLLHFLISGHHGAASGTETLPTIDFVRLNKNFDVETRDRKPPPKMPDKPEAPPETPAPQVELQGAVQNSVSIGPMNVENTTAVKSGFGLASSDGEYLPIVKVAPMYPASAQSRGIEGWVLLEFTVTEIGAVANPVVVEAQPAGVFDEAAKKAVLKFKYKPRVENGVAVAVPKVQHLITFKIEKK